MQSALLKEQLELEKYVTHDGKKRYRIKPFEDELSFDKGFFVFIRALQLLTSNNEGTVVVGLAGPSGSGKTAFSEKVRSFMPGVCVISMDNYNDGSKVVDSNFDDPRLADYELLLRNIEDLRNGHATEAPIYDFKMSCRNGYRHVEVPSSRVVIIEGIYALTERLRHLLDLRVSITGGIHFDLVKRVLRDLNRSGQQADTIIQQVSDTVYPMYKAFIEPDLKTAHLKIHNNFNPFSGFICNPVYILKSALEVPMEDIMSVLDEEKVEKTETEMVDIYLLPPNEDPEQCSSWLRMRSRDGRYSLMFEEWVTEVPFVISPRISFEVSVRILGGLMALGYEIGPILKRRSIVVSDGNLSIKLDTIEKLGKFIQIQGDSREKVATAGTKLGLDGNYIPRSYIEQIQLADLVAALKSGDLTEHLGVVADVALSRESSDVPTDVHKDDLYCSHTLTRQRSRELHMSRSLPDQLLTLTDPVRISFPNAGSQDRRSHSDEGILKNGMVTGLLQTELQRSPRKDDHENGGAPPTAPLSHASHEVSGQLLDATKTELSALIQSLNAVSESLRHQRVDYSPLMWSCIGCLCFMTGLLTGWMLGKQ
eukprot:g3728.t2